MRLCSIDGRSVCDGCVKKGWTVVHVLGAILCID